MQTPLRATPEPVPVDVSPRFLQGRGMVPGGREDWKRLASYVVSARLAAGYKDRRALAAATGITDRTLGTLENGRRVSPETLASVERAVGWKPDSARRVLAGGEPVPATDIGGEAAEPRFTDPRLQHVMGTPGLDLETRLLLVDLTRAMIARQGARERPA